MQVTLNIQTLPVREENYAEAMQTVVEPALAALRREGEFESFDGNKIHYEAYVKADAAGAIVISHGFTESAEKFREMSYCFLQMGFAVFAVDHRGHGRSFRYNPGDLQTVTIRKFEDYVEDLHCFVETVVKPAAGSLPLYLYAHSMGGAIAVQYLQTYPATFDKAILSAPMIQAQMPIPPAVTLAMTKVFSLIGKKDARVFVHKGFNPDATFEDSHDTSEARYNYYKAKRIADPLLQTSAASYRWVEESVKVVKKNLDPARCVKIQCPVLLCQPAEDKSVISERENDFIALVPHGRLVQIPDSRHEIYLSIDSALLFYLQTIEAFLKGEDAAN